MEHNKYCDTIGETYRKNKSVDFPLNVNNNKKKVAARKTITKESRKLIKKNAQRAEFSIVTPEQSKYIKTVDMAILSMFPENDLFQTAYRNELLETNKPEQQNNNFRFPTSEILGDFVDHNPIQTQVLREFMKLKEKEEIKPQNGRESRTKFLERFD